MEMDIENVHEVPPPQTFAPDEFRTDYDEYYTERTPLAIDNGSTDLRYGWATTPEPLSSKNAMAKYRDRRNAQKQLLLFGASVDLEGPSRLATRSTWEGDVLVNPEVLESGLDYAFLRLGITAESVDHPIIMTERLASPMASRALTSELLFECYTIPSVAFCVDALMSHSFNRSETPLESRDGLVLSFNTASTSIIPVLDGKGILSQARRLPWGGTQAIDFLNKLVNLKYPTFPAKIAPYQYSWMLHNFCSFSPTYLDTIRSLATPSALTAADIIVQFPYTLSVTGEKTEEQIALLAEKRREGGRRLQEQAAKNREAKASKSAPMARREEDLKYLNSLKEYSDSDRKADYIERLRSEGFQSEALLDEDIKRLEQALRRGRKKDEAVDDEPMEEPTFPLVDIPDNELNDEQIKEKRKQRLAKAGHDARIRARIEKAKDREAQAELERQEQLVRDADPSGWAARVRREHHNVMEKIRDRKKRREAMMDRKSSAAQTRMKNIASLADDQPATKKRKKVNNEDLFGQNDSDWLIYRKVNLDDASDEEEEDLATLNLLESKLLDHDPSFSYDHTYEGISSRGSALMGAFRPKYPEGDTQGAHRIHLNVERWRVPETWFLPGMAGVDSAGLGELVENVLKTFKEEERVRLVKSLFLTGSPASLPGLPERLTNTIQPIMPPDTPITVAVAQNPRLDAWRGMAAFARTPQLTKVSVTRDEYQEWGGERVKDWFGGSQ